MQTGRIYKIIHTRSDICYVGSTFDAIRNRFRRHKGKDSGCSIGKYMLEYGSDQFKMVLIKEYQVVDRKHLEAYEQLWINKLNCINIMRTFSPLKKQMDQIRMKKFRDENTEWLKQYHAKHYLENKEAISEKSKKYREKNKEKLNESILCECGHTFTAQHVSRHIKAARHLAFINKTVKVQKLPTDRITCECGVIYSRSNKCVHKKKCTLSSSY